MDEIIGWDVDRIDRRQPPWQYYYGPSDTILLSTVEYPPESFKQDTPDWCYPERYQRTANDTALLADAKKRNQLSKIVKQFGTWALTTYGMESLTWHYHISRDQLLESKDDYPWPKHMGAKTWVNLADFRACYDAALEYFSSKRPTFRTTKEQPVVPSAAKALIARPIKVAKPARVRPVRMAFTRTERFLIMKRDAYRCCICGRDASDGAKLEVDHKHAKSKGGAADLNNGWTLCYDCNRGKGTREL